MSSTRVRVTIHTISDMRNWKGDDWNIRWYWLLLDNLNNRHHNDIIILLWGNSGCMHSVDGDMRYNLYIWGFPYLDYFLDVLISWIFQLSSYTGFTYTCMIVAQHNILYLDCTCTACHLPEMIFVTVILNLMTCMLESHHIDNNILI